jgi:hypothetical protein
MANLYKGYIITLNGYHLTGQIGEIYLEDNQKRVVFINDFGTPYMISPRLIAGFSFKDGEELITYRSSIIEKEWVFLRVISEGEGIRLLKTPEKETEIIIDQYGLSTQTYRTKRYFIQLGDRLPEKVKRLGFRKQMRRLLSQRAPELAEKIGQKGYRWKNLTKIAREYEEVYLATRYIM